MRIIYSKEYLRKSGILNYPFTGYYYQLGKVKSETNNYESWYNSYNEKHSIFYPCNTMIKKFNGELRCKISFLIHPLESEERKDYRVIYISALDNTLYNNLEELEKINANEQNDRKNFEQVAAVIIMDEKSKFIIKDNINILDMQYVPKCSFSIVEFDNDQVIHYQSEDYDKSNLYMANDNQFIEFNSGNDRLRDLMATQNPIDLRGHMTIRKSGVIQL